MKPLKILLLVILLALIPQATASIFINQTAISGSTTMDYPHTQGQNFTTPSYANTSQYKLDYVEVLGETSVLGSTQNIDMQILNATWHSNNVTVTWRHLPGGFELFRYNFSDVILESGKNNYNFTLSSYLGANQIDVATQTPSLYSGGLQWIDNLPIVNNDLTFNISLSPHDNVGNWTLNEGTGAYANDSSSFFNNGTIYGGIPWATNLNNGSVNSTALNFYGYGNVSVPTNETLNLTSAGSISMWYNVKQDSTNKALLSKGRLDALNDAYGLFISTTGVLAGDLVTTVAVDTVNGGNTQLNHTNFVVFEWNDSTISIYQNGFVSGTAPKTVNLVPSTSKLTMGSTSNGLYNFTGMIDEVKMYNYALNQSEITAIYQQFQPVPSYPVGGVQISPTEATTYVNFSWHDTVYPQDELIIATDSGFTNIIHDAFHSTDYANISLTVGTTYYWKVRQFDSGTGSYGNTSAIQIFTLGTVPTFIRVNVFDELNQTPLININATLTSIATNTSVNLSSTGSYVNFTNPNITDGVEYLAQIGAIGYTTRNILITSPGNYSIYLPYTATPTGVSQINFVESDYTGMFPYQSTKLIVQKVINTTLVNISSNYFDATGLSTAQLINGQLYQLVVESTVSTRVLGSYIPTASATQTLLIGTFTLQPSSAFNGLVYNFTYNSNQSIVLQWNDPNEEIISLNETITNQLNAIVLQLITSVHSGQTTYLIANTSSKYLVQLNISTVHYGYLLYSLWYNPALFTSANASLAPTPGPNNFVIPFGNASNVSTTSNANAPIPQWVKNFFSVSVLVIMALLFNREHVLRGAVVVSLFSLVFWLTGMLVFDVGYITTGAILGMGFVISVIALLAESNRG